MTATCRQLLYDLRHSARALAQRPGFTLVVTLVFGLGVGANVAVFGVAHALFLRPLPAPHAERLVGVFQTRAGRGHHPMSWPDFLDYRRRSTAFEALAAHYSMAPLHVVAEPASGLLTGSVVSGDYFPMLGVEPARGRFFDAAELAFGGPPVAVLSHRLWQRWFDGAPAAIGAVVEINDVAFTVVGVAAEGFLGALVGTTNDLWIPSSQAAVGYRFCASRERDCTFLNVLGRLAPGRTAGEAGAELERIAERLARQFPDSHAELGVAVVPARGVRPDTAAHQARIARTLAMIVGAVLLIAGANLASLVLVRHWSRRAELGIRRALGASRGRIVGQLLGEALLLAALGAVAALAFGVVLRRLLLGHFAIDPAWATGGAAAPLLAFTVALSLAAGLGIAIAPALFASRDEPSTALRAQRFAREGRWRFLLVVGQLAVSLALLVGTGLLAGSLLHLERDAPIESERLVSLRLRPRLAGFDLVRARAAEQAVVEHLERLPWIESASFAQGLPSAPFHDPVPVRRPELAAERQIDVIEAGYDRIAPGYFATLGLPLRGREFEPGDDDRVLVGTALAERLWPNGDAVGRRLIVDGRELEVLGVAPDLHRRRTGEPRRDVFYLPFLASEAIDARLIVRVRGDASAALEPLRAEVARFDPALPVSEVATLESRLADAFRPVRLTGAVIAAASAVGLLLSAIGLYGVLALRVARRTREIGVRMAVGARPRDVIRLILREGVGLGAAGVLLGAPLAVLLARGLTSYLYGLSPYSPAPYLSMATALLAVVLAASWIPARRAAAVEPTTALRAE